VVAGSVTALLFGDSILGFFSDDEFDGEGGRAIERVQTGQYL